jgi:lipoate-protein ligase B
MHPLNFIHLGLTDYASAQELQTELRARRQRGEVGDTLLLLEHPRVITRGRRPAHGDFRIAPEVLRRKGFAIEDARRGGRLTYHGPGQLVVYFIVSLKERGWKVPAFVAAVEQTAILTLRHFGVEAGRRKGCPGVWVRGAKIAAIGLSIDRGVSMHGLALNVDPDLKDFEVIIPCGIEDCAVTSLKRETGQDVALDRVERAFCRAARQVYESS